MTSIGPQIPEHLLKRLQSSEDQKKISDEESRTEPESSVHASLDTQIPTHLTKPSTLSNIAENEDDDDDDYGPALPPELLAKRPESLTTEAYTSVQSSSASGPMRRIIGPSLPGHNRQSYSDEDGDEDEGYGPMPLPEEEKKIDGVSEGVREFMEREKRRAKEVEEAAKPKKPKREEWMLVPPSSSDLLGHLGDPTKLKARQFSRGSSTTTRSASNNLWTETPEERQQRVADEVAGKKRRAANADDDIANDRDVQKKRQRDMELRMVVDEHNKSSRSKTLLEMHEAEKKKETKSKKGGEEPVAIWDHARDMSVGGRLMDENQRSKMVLEARSLGDRFGSGKGGGYL